MNKFHSAFLLHFPKLVSLPIFIFTNQKNGTMMKSQKENKDREQGEKKIGNDIRRSKVVRFIGINGLKSHQ